MENNWYVQPGHDVCFDTISGCDSVLEGIAVFGPYSKKDAERIAQELRNDPFSVLREGETLFDRVSVLQVEHLRRSEEIKSWLEARKQAL